MLHAADGANRDGTPYQPAVFLATQLNADYRGRPTDFALAVDSAAAVGTAAQVRVSYDLTGDGTWDRVETYRYFAVDPLPGAEQYTPQVGLLSATGGLGNLVDGSVKVEVWSAFPGTGNSVPTMLAGSSVTLPFS